MKNYLILFLLFSLSVSGAVVDYRALRQDQFTTNLPSAGYVGIKGYGVTNIPGTNVNISAGGSIIFTTNGPNITITVTGLGQATNAFLIAGTNIFIVTNGTGTWTISGLNYWRTNAAYAGGISNLYAGPVVIGDPKKAGGDPKSILVASRIVGSDDTSTGDTLFGYLQFSTDVSGNTTFFGGDNNTLTIQSDGNLYFNGGTLYDFQNGSPMYGNGTSLTNLNGTNIDIVYDGGLTASSNGVHRVTVSINTNAVLSLATNVVQNNSGVGSVTSVAMTGDGVIFSNTIPGSPITSSGTLVPGLLKEADNKVLAGPITGASATPTFRSLAAEDLPVIAGSNVTLSTNSNVLTISSSSSGGGVTGGTTNVVTTNTPAGVTNFVNSQITNQIPNFIHGTTNQFAKFSPNTNEVGDSILSETTSNFVDLKAGGGAGTTPNGSSAAGYRVYGTFTNSTSFKRMDMDWSVADSAFRVLAAVGSSVGAGQAPILEIGSSNVSWAWTTTGTLYPMSDNNYNLGSSANARIKTIAVGTGGVVGSIGSSGAPNYTVAGAGGWYDTGDTMGFLGVSSGEQFRMAKAGGVGGAYFNLGANPLVGSPSGVTVQNSYLVSAGVNTWAVGTNLTSSTITTNRITGANSTGSNIPGGHMAISGGAPTGSGTPGAVIFETATNGAAVSTQGGRTTRGYISGHQVTLTESSPTLVCNVALAAKGYVGGTFKVTTTADDGTDGQANYDCVAFSAWNKAGVVTVSYSASAPSSSAATTGSLTTTVSVIANSATLDFKVNAVSSLTQTTLQCLGRLEIDSDATCPVTWQ